VIAFFRDKKIDPRNRLGRVYVVTTALTALTGFGIFQHGGFGKPHALGILTLVVLAIAVLASRSRLFGRYSAYVETVGFSLTFFFHMIPGVTETTTRLPLGAPLLPNADAPELLVAAGVMFMLFLLGAAMQVKQVRAARF
jgi:uncharacterized membrane protein